MYFANCDQQLVATDQFLKTIPKIKAETKATYLRLYWSPGTSGVKMLALLTVYIPLNKPRNQTEATNLRLYWSPWTSGVKTVTLVTVYIPLIEDPGMKTIVSDRTLLGLKGAVEECLLNYYATDFSCKKYSLK